jgi:hypothetical protein
MGKKRKGDDDVRLKDIDDPGNRKPVAKRKKFQKLMRMKCWLEVDRRVRAGYPLKDVARYIQEDREEYCGVKAMSLERELGRYRDSLPTGEVMSRNAPITFLKKAREFDEGQDELVYLDRLMTIQLERIEKIYIQEDKIGIWLPSRRMPAEIDEGRKLAYTRAQLKMDLGLSKRDIGKLTLESELIEKARSKWGDEMAQTVADPESRRKVIDIMDYFKELKRVQQRENHLKDLEDIEN